MILAGHVDQQPAIRDRRLVGHGDRRQEGDIALPLDCLKKRCRTHGHRGVISAPDRGEAGDLDRIRLALELRVDLQHDVAGDRFSHGGARSLPLTSTISSASTSASGFNAPAAATIRLCGPRVILTPGEAVTDCGRGTRFRLESGGWTAAGSPPKVIPQQVHAQASAMVTAKTGTLVRAMISLLESPFFEGIIIGTLKSRVKIRPVFGQVECRWRECRPGPVDQGVRSARSRGLLISQTFSPSAGCLEP